MTGEAVIANASPVDFSTAAPLYLRNNLTPIPVKGKSPVPAGATGRNGVVDAEKITAWAKDPEWASENTALRAEGYIGIDVDDYGDNSGAIELAALEAELGTLPATITSTARGQDSASRQHFYIVPEGVEFPGNIAPSIEIVQRHHRYSVVWPSFHPLTGSQYEWYDFDGESMIEVPALADFERLPEAWIDHFRIERIEHGAPRASAMVVETASETEARSIGSVIRSLESLPAVWAPGAGWHDTVFKACAWLSRMVNAPDYAMTEDAALALMLEYTPTYPGWGQDEIIRQWESAIKSNNGAQADLPDESLPPLLPFLETANTLPEYTSTGEVFGNLLLAEATVKTDGQIWALRKKILTEIMRAGFTDEEAVSVTWGCPASVGLQAEPHGLAKLWREVPAARNVVDKANGANAAPPAVDERPALADSAALKRVDLMTDSEREQARAVDWFGKEYLGFAEESVSVMNAPYHRMNLWTIISLIYSPHAVIPLAGGVDVPLIIYQMILGETTTGKSESIRLLKTVLKCFYSVEDNPNIGGDPSPNALIEKLIERDGKASWFNRDEAHGLLRQMRGKEGGGWMAGLEQILTLLFDGEVPIILRNGKRDISGVDASTFFIMQLMATMGGMTEVLEPRDWESGFLNRFIWAVGEKAERTKDSMKIKLRRGTEAKGGDPRLLQKQWAATFNDNVRLITRSGTDRIAEMDITEEVEERHNALTYTLSTMTDGHKHEHMLKPTFVRFSLTVLKCACLVALAQGRTQVTVLDHLVALEFAEEWAANILLMVGKTNETGFSRQVNNLERFIAKQPGQKTRLEKVYGHLEMPIWDANKLVDQLTATGRAKKYRDKATSAEVIEIRESEAAA